MFPEYIIHLQNAVKKLAFINDMHDHITSEFKTGKLSVLIFRSFGFREYIKFALLDPFRKKKSIFAYLTKAQIRNESRLYFR